MVVTVYSLLGGLVMLIVGLASYGFLHRVLYPALRWRYERMKAYGRRGIESARLDGVAESGQSSGLADRWAAIRGPGTERDLVMTR
jgi:hypothetical protein